MPGEAFTITDRHVTLSGLLADGEQFNFELNSFDTNPYSDDDDVFEPDSRVTVTLTAPFTLGDVNLDGVVGFSDIPAFIEILIAS